MLMKKFNVQWTPGVCVDQVVEISLDSLDAFSIVGDGVLKEVVEYVVSVPSTTLNATVRVGSRAPGQAVVYSDTYTFAVTLIPPPVELTPATGLSVTYIGEEEVS